MGDWKKAYVIQITTNTSLTNLTYNYTFDLVILFFNFGGFLPK